jgi:hypothetical protein
MGKPAPFSPMKFFCSEFVPHRKSLYTVSKISRVFNSYKGAGTWFTEGCKTREMFRPERNLDLHGTKFGLLLLYFTLSNELELKHLLIWVTDVVVMEVSSLYPSHAKRNS